MFMATVVYYVVGAFRNQSLAIAKEERPTGKSEWELRKEQGYRRIWDCGHRTYVFNLENL